jgi:hypothetical protein
LIFRKLLTYAAAAIVMATAAGVCVVAAAFALYALAHQYLTAPASGAVVAVAAAILVFIVGLILSQKLHTTAKKTLPADQVPLTERLIDVAKEHPLIAGGAAIAATFLAVRNPKILTGALSAYLAARAARSAPPPPPRRKR